MERFPTHNPESKENEQIPPFKELVEETKERVSSIIDRCRLLATRAKELPENLKELHMEKLESLRFRASMSGKVLVAGLVLFLLAVEASGQESGVAEQTIEWNVDDLRGFVESHEQHENAESEKEAERTILEDNYQRQIYTSLESRRAYYALQMERLREGIDRDRALLDTLIARKARAYPIDADFIGFTRVEIEEQEEDLAFMEELHDNEDLWRQDSTDYHHMFPIGDSARRYMIGILESEEYKRRLIENEGMDENEVEERIKQLYGSDYSITDSTVTLPESRYLGMWTVHKHPGGSEWETIVVRTLPKEEESAVRETVIHEYEHSITRADEHMSDLAYTMLGDSFEPFSEYDDEDNDYLSSPEERAARVRVLREFLENGILKKLRVPYGDEVKQIHIDWLRVHNMQNPESLPRNVVQLLNTTPKDVDLIRILNTLADSDNDSSKEGTNQEFSSA